MLQWPVHIPDAQRWHDELRYSDEVALALIRAHLCIRAESNKYDAWRKAHAIVHPYSKKRMSLHQRLQVVYILALGHYACGEYKLSLGCLDEALEISLRLTDRTRLFLILYMRGSVHSSSVLLREAAADLSESLFLIEQSDIDRLDQKNRWITLDAHLQLATIEFFLASYAQSAAHLDKADELVPESPDLAQTEARILWIRALHERLCGNLDIALKHAIKASELYAKFQTPDSLARIQVVVADIALDMCERMPPGWGFDNNLHVAVAYTDWSIESLGGIADCSGQGLVKLTLARAARLSGVEGRRAINSKHIIENVIASAMELDDVALLCQAYVGLGAELMASNKDDAGRFYYRKALHISNQKGVSALAAPARRALLRYEEMSESHG